MANQWVVAEIRFNNIPQFDEQLHDQLRRMLLKAALDIEGRAKMKAPIRTGTLKSSIRTWWEGPLTICVGTSLHYAPYVELGTRYMAARPYLKPAAEEVLPSLKGAMWKYL